MDQQNLQYHKAYVEVTVKVSPEGEKRPQTIIFETGITYTIDRLKQRTRAAATKVGGTGIRYTVVINGTETYLFEDDDRWFVEAKGNAGC